MAFEDSEDLAAMFDSEDGFAVAAIYRAGGVGVGVAVSIIPARPDGVVDVFGQSSRVATGKFLVRVAEVANPSRGDTLEVSGTLYTVNSAPKRDDGRMVWTLETAED